MDGKFKVEVVTPTSIDTIDEVTHVKAPGLDGSFGVLKRHIGAVIAITEGEIRVDHESAKDYYVTSGGYCEIGTDRITFLVETAEPAGEIDVQRAEAARDRAKARLKERSSALDGKRADAALMRAINRLRAAKRA